MHPCPEIRQIKRVAIQISSLQVHLVHVKFDPNIYPLILGIFIIVIRMAPLAFIAGKYRSEAVAIGKCMDLMLNFRAESPQMGIVIVRLTRDIGHFSFSLCHAGIEGFPSL